MSGVNFMQFVQVTNPASATTQKKATTVSLLPLAPFDKNAYLAKIPATNFESDLLNVMSINDSPSSVQGPLQIKEMGTNIESIFKREKVVVTQQYVKVVDNISNKPGVAVLNPNGP